MSNEKMGSFARTTMKGRYAHDLPIGGKEDWHDIALRVPTGVFSAIPDIDSDIVDSAVRYMNRRVMVPAGRYLYATGRPFHQTNNCMLFRAEDTREGWANQNYKSTMALMTGAGIGVWYGGVRPNGAIIRRTGGVSSGPLALMRQQNEIGREVMQGGARRSAIWAGLPWDHGDVFDFIRLKDWSPEVRAMKERDFNFPAPMDMTNISVGLDDAFFEAFSDVSNSMHEHAQKVYWTVIKRMRKTGEPGFSINCGKESNEQLRNAPVCAETRVLTPLGYRTVGEIVDTPEDIWTGQRWALDVVFKKTGEYVPTVRVSFTGGREIVCDPTHEFLVERYQGAGARRELVCIERVPAGNLEDGDILHWSPPRGESGHFSAREYTLGFAYGDGSFRNRKMEITICSERKSTCVESMIDPHSSFVDSRGFLRMSWSSDSHLGRTKSQYPRVRNPASFLAGLFDADGSWDEKQSRIRLSSVHRGFLRGVREGLEALGIMSHIQDKTTPSGYGGRDCYTLFVAAEYVTRFHEIVPTKRLKTRPHEAYRPSRIKVTSVEPAGRADVFCCDVKHEEHSFMAEGVIISNCTEITSEDDSDVCNLAHGVLPRVKDLDEWAKVVRTLTAFCLAGSVYSHVPFPEVAEVRDRNRRLGVGHMGMHEWLMRRGKQYGQDTELSDWFRVYEEVTEETADELSAEWGLSRPVKLRAIAPTGTTGIEPMFCAAYKRRYLDQGTEWKYQYVVDPVARRMVDEFGLDPNELEDAYTLAEDPERRVSTQAWAQKYVDHGISSTLNLPAWGSRDNNEGHVEPFGKMLLKYLPDLRGITTYPDGARGGQPMTTIRYEEAVRHEGEVFTEGADICDITGAGTCGD